MGDPRKLWRELRAFALDLPGAYEDFPWENDLVAKVNKKIFVFLGAPDRDDYPPGISVKLRESHELALAADGTKPSGYGLGKSGWVSVSLPETQLPREVLMDWVEESYRLRAPKRLVAELDARAPTP